MVNTGPISGFDSQACAKSTNYITFSPARQNANGDTEFEVTLPPGLRGDKLPLSRLDLANEMVSGTNAIFKGTYDKDKILTGFTIRLPNAKLGQAATGADIQKIKLQTTQAILSNCGDDNSPPTGILADAKH